MRVVLACDKFKGSLSGSAVAAALGRGIRRVDPGAEVAVVPVADGGDGSLLVALAAGLERRAVVVSGPTGLSVRSAYARRGDLAVVELADASGLARLPAGPAPLDASTHGTGQLLAAALDAGCTQIVLGVGGSCSTDGGAGLVTGLGGRIGTASGAAVRPGGSGLAAAATLDLTAVARRLAGVRLVLACDVDNPLLGPTGAAAVYAPQKGAGPADVALLEAALRTWADLVTDHTGWDARWRAGAGAAGGSGYGALSLLGAELRSGIDTFLDLADFAGRAAGADLVVTGEGSLDEQTLRGKAPVGVLRAARDLGLPVVAVCGRTTLDPATLAAAGFARTWSLAAREPDPVRSMADAAALLEDVGADLARAVPDLTARTASSPG